MAGGVEYQVTKVDPTDPTTKGMVYQVHAVSEEVAALLGGKTYRARIINDPSDPYVKGKVYQIVLIDDPTGPTVKGKVYNAILTGGSTVVVVGPGVSPLELPSAVADSLQYVKAFGGVEQRNVPEGYAELEYIEGDTNTQYINTNIVPNSSMEISAKVQLMSDAETTSTFFFGGRTQSTGGTGVAGMWSPSELIFDWFGTSSSDRYSVSATRTVGDILEYSVNNSLVTIKRNGTVAGTHQFTPTGTSTQPLYVNGMNNGGSIISNNSAKARVYRFTIAGIADFIPARRKSDGVVGMYDIIRKQFFTNAGTGTFTAGAEVTAPSPTLPRDIWCNNGAIKAIRPIEYLESTGTQYIDTGVSPTLDTVLELKGIQGAGDCALFGVASGCYAFNNNPPQKPLALFAAFLDSSAGPLSVNLRDTPHIIQISKENGLVVDDTQVATFNNTTADTYNSMFLFARRNSDGTAGKLGSHRIYYAKIYDSGTLVRDFIPALDTNNVPCMFDKVEGKCYYNQGTGQFIAPYLPAEYERLEYIESTGTQYIDTGINFANSDALRIVADMQYTNLPSDAPQYFGIYAGAYFGVNDSSWSIGGNAQGTANTTRHVFDFSTTIGINQVHTLKVDDTSYAHTRSNQSGTAGVLNTVSGNYFNYAKLYSVKIYKNSSLTFDGIPAKDSNNVVGMYDLVSRQFFTNAGTGSFTCDSSYTELEYIECTGMQYIDTGYAPSSNTKVDLVGSGKDIPGGTRFGSRKSTTEDKFYLLRPQQGSGISVAFDNVNAVTTSQANYNRFIIDGPASSSTIYYDDDTSDTIQFTDAQPFSGTHNLLLFALDAGTTITNAVSCKVNSCKIWDNGTLVRDFVPAKRNGDNAIGLYDKVSKKFYTNAGTGVFTAGSEIPTPIDPLPIELMVDGTVEKVMITQQEVPAGYLPLEYLEANSTNNQYIDTGFKPNNNTRVVADVMTTGTNSSSVNAYTACFGCRTTASSKSYGHWQGQASDSTGYRIDYNVTQSPGNASSSLLDRVTIDKNKNTTTIYKNGQPIVTATMTAGTFQCDYNMYLFGFNNAGARLGYESIRFYSCKIYDDDTLVRDFIPAKRLSDNVVGMLDLVNNVFYTNAGTGTFVAGQEINTATCENLFATQTLKDEQEILSGDVVRNVGIAVLTGQENWTAESTWFKANVFTGNSMDNAIVCSHFERGLITQDNTVARSAGTTVMMLHYSACANVAALKSWLASQYNAGTPVIVLYALETAETESVAGQTLNVVEGDNYAEIMQASIDGLMLEAKYEKEG